MEWYKIKNMAEGSELKAEINIFEQIGYDWWDGSGVTAKGFIDAVNALGELDEIHINMSTPGGAVFDALPIYNYLKGHKAKVIVNNFGMIASAGTVIAMAADVINMPSNTIFMIHDPASYAAGNADEMRKAADTLDTIKDGIVSAYVEKTGLSAEKVSELMTAETYMTAQDALDYGFVDSLGDDIEATNSHDMKLVKANAEVKAQAKRITALTEQLGEKEQTIAAQKTEIENLKNPEPRARAEAQAVIEACNKASFKNLAVGFIENGYTIDQVTAQLERAGKIQNVCAAAGLDGSVLAIVNEADPVEMVRVAIVEAQAALDQDTNNQRTPGSGSNGRVINSADIYEKRKQGK